METIKWKTENRSAAFVCKIRSFPPSSSAITKHTFPHRGSSFILKMIFYVSELCTDKFWNNSNVHVSDRLPFPCPCLCKCPCPCPWGCPFPCPCPNPGPSNNRYTLHTTDSNVYSTHYWANVHPHTNDTNVYTLQILSSTHYCLHTTDQRLDKTDQCLHTTETF
jgi:hypothetical protein